MATQDTSIIKDKIISAVKNRGPSLPVHLAKASGQSILFASAFLSELLAEKKLKTSNLRVGSSPLYLAPGQEAQLENFSQHLKSKEKDAFEVLKQKKFIKDSEQEPAIRVALRAIKDFAIPFNDRNSNELYWRYFTTEEKDFYENQKPQEEKPKEIEKPQEPKKKEERESPSHKPTESISQQQASENPLIDKEQLNIFDKEENSNEELTPSTSKHLPTKKPKKKTTKKKSSSTKKQDQFFNEVKNHLNQKNIEIIDIEGVAKNELTLKVKENEKELLLIALDKKRVDERDIQKAFKKSQEANIPYKILSKGEPLKKLTNLLEALSTLQTIEKIEQNL